MAEGSPNKSGE
jgi:serine/threonine protein kinase